MIVWEIGKASDAYTYILIKHGITTQPLFESKIAIPFLLPSS